MLETKFEIVKTSDNEWWLYDGHGYIRFYLTICNDIVIYLFMSL